MRRKILLTLIFTIFAFSACQTASTGNSADAPQTTSVQDEKASNASKLDESAQKALIDALADERRAFAEYEAVLGKFGDARPFSNIVNAEKRHESFLLPLFEKYDLKVPENEFSKDKVQVPATLTEACRNGIKGEEANIEMYDRFLGFVKEQDIREVFTYLRDASKNNHLPAFQRCAEGGRGMGNGRGQGRPF